MMKEQLGFSVLSAPLAALDRRAISQAWYSALHLAGNRSPASTPMASQGSGLVASAVHMKQAPPAEHGATGSQAQVRAQERHHVASRVDATQPDRRVLRSPLARKIETAFLRPTKPLHRATFTIGGESRVHISIQNSGFGMSLVAVCAPAVRGTVAKALDEARYALAARGISIGVSLSAGADAD
jgi:hypothetical protein